LNNNFFDNLEGTWCFDRQISTLENKIKGYATFTRKDATHLDYYEKGAYTVNDISYDFFQKRLFEREESNLTIYKIDNSILHSFDNINYEETYPLRLTHSHLCGLDTYNCLFVFVNKLYFKINYSIIGDKKNYTIKTCYKKCS
jgi:hypothetical protein